MNYLESALEIMALPDLFQWLEGARKTGLCTFSYRDGTRRVWFRNGEIIACSGTEPHLLLGQFLISNGRLDPELLQTLLQVQEHTGKTLGTLILREGLLEREELQRLVTAKAEETIFGLFDRTDVAFRFDPDRDPPDDVTDLNLNVQSALMEAARRTDELNRARERFGSRHVILHRTDRKPDPAAVASYMGRALYEAINGQRTLGELILHCRTSEYLACSFLLRLLELDIIRLGEVHQPAAKEADGTDAADRIRYLVTSERYAEALELAERSGVQAGHDQYLAMLLARAESGFIAEIYRTRIPPDSVPFAVDTGEDRLRELQLDTDDLFVLELADGSWNIRSLARIAPMRKVDLLRSMNRLLEAGLIRLEEGDKPELEGRETPESGSDLNAGTG